MKRLIITFISLVILGILFNYCRHDPSGIDQMREVCFEKEVLPIFQANCTMSGCHGAQGQGYDFRTYNGIMQAISPGDPKGSPAYQAMTNAWGSIMPPKGNNQLTREQRTLIYIWILQGASKTLCPSDTIPQDTIPQDTIPLTDSICFQQKILPMLQSSCGVAGCHDQTSAQHGVILTGYEGIMALTPIQLVIPGNATGSKIYQVVNTNMPPSPNTPLTALQKKKILTWIIDGALNNSCGIIDTIPIDTIPIDTIPVDTTPINDSICFQQKILPILQSSCALVSCHDAITAQGDLILTNYNGIRYPVEGTLVVPGNATGSKLFRVITGQGEDLMPPPPKQPLTAQQIEWFRTWINDGALNSSCESGCDTTNITFGATVNPLIQTFCLGCHSGATPTGGISLSGYSNVYIVATNGKLMGVLKHLTGFPSMPPAGSLSACHVRQVEIWIQNGSLNNK